MKETNYTELIQYYEKKKRRRSVLKRVVFALSVVVVFCTVYSLILPAITMVNEDIAICGFEEHLHDETCYKETEKITYDCEGIHVHNATCYDGSGKCVCGFADYVIHTHDENCYTAEGELACGLPEIEEHTHTGDCVKNITEYICGKEEHTHSDNCYEEEKTLICEITDEAHEHTDECFETVSTLVCGKEEHNHTGECEKTEAKRVCGCEEPVYHKHTDACYESGKLVCGKTEVTAAAFHQHTDACYENGELVCGHIEILRHQHTDCAVRTTEKVLICEKPEHKHTDACIPAEEEPVKKNEYTCGFSYEHTHDESCKKDGKLVCTLPEHTHTPECKKDMTADIETPETIAKSYERAQFTGSVNDDVLLAASTQLGYRESDRNFVKNDDGRYKGYTRYGEWYGDPYADWDALFCSCCLHFAGIGKEVFPAYSDRTAWLSTATDAGLRREVGEYTPQPGDIVFLKSASAEAADAPAHMGFVNEVTKQNGLTVRTIEGDLDDRVSDEAEYTADEILCFCVLPGSDEDIAGRLVSITTETPDGIRVTVEALPSSLPFPVDELTVRAQLVENATADRLTSEELEENGLAATQKLYFDIKLIHDGEEVEPTGPLTVSISGIAGQGTSSVEVYHIDTENEELETMAAQLDEEQNVNIETDHFSLYAVSLLGATDVSSLTELSLSNGGNVTLDKDYKITSTKNISRNTTLNLNGHNLYVTCDPAFNVTGGTLTINDSKAPEATAQTVSGSMNSNVAEYAAAQRINVASFTAPSTSTFSPWGDGAVANLFDNNAGTKMGGNVTGGSVTVEFVPADTSAIITSYVLTSASDTGNYSTRVPKSWVLSGQRSGSTSWTQISSVSSMPTDSSTDHTYETTATRGYAKYRIVFQTNSQFQMADLKLYSASDEKLTYYVTETQVIDTDTGATAETLKKYTVTPSDGGLIVGNQNGRFITMSGGTVNLNGGYITNFSKSVNTEDSRGGAVKVTGGTLNIDGAVLAGNKASDGGAIQVTGSNAVLNIKSGVISGNDATRAHQFPTSESRYGGGGVYLGPGSTVNMTGGYVTNNICSNAAGATHGGGAFMVNGAHLNISGGYITGNGGPGGGAIMTSRANSYDAGGKIYMTGGFVTANTSYTKEGGGISIDGYGYLSLTGGYVTNNIASGGVNNANFHDWGGGGIFVSDAQALLYVENVLITENKAGGFGGGIAGCSTGRLNIAVEDVCANYDNVALGEHLSGAGNQKNEDHAYAADSDEFMENGYRDYYCALSSIVSGGMLGGGTSYWTGSVDGVPVHSTSPDDTLIGASVMGLTSHPTEEDKANASEAARVFINGNESPTHGGGILANGYLMIGPQKIESFCRLAFTASKNIVDGAGSTQSLDSRVFDFVIADEYGNIVAEGKNNSSGTIDFDNRLAFTDAGTFNYYAYELPPGADAGTQIVNDSSKYKIAVQVEKITSTIRIDDKNYTKEVFQFKQVTVYDSATGNTVRTYKTSDGTLTNNENHAVSLDPTGGRAFKNYKVSYITPSVKKVWTGGGNHAPITVHLCRNGEVIDTQTLSSSNSWSYTWSRQNTVVNSQSAVYTVTEDPVDGYVTTYSVTTATTSSSSRVTQETTITNTPESSTYKINIKKVSKSDNSILLPGAEFEIHDAEDNALTFVFNETTGRYALSTAANASPKLVTGTNGYIRADGFSAGNYTLVETKSPPGYDRIERVDVVINNTLPDQALSITLEDPDERGGVLIPATGGIGSTPFYAAGTALLGTSLALLFTFGKRRKKTGEAEG